MMEGHQEGQWVFASEEWKESFLQLGKWLKVKVDALTAVSVH